MKFERLVPLAAATSLAVLYLGFAYSFVQSDLLQRATSLEQGMFVLQIGKMAVVSSVGRLRGMRFINVINVLGAELVVALPALTMAYLAFGDQGTSTLMNQIFLGWTAGAAASLSPYGIYRLTKAMLRRHPLDFVLTSGELLSELLLLLQAGANASIATQQGLAGLSKTIILLGGGTTLGPQIVGLAALIPLSVLYVSLLLHSLSPPDVVRPAKFVIIAVMAVLATTVTYSGTYAAAAFAVPFAYLVLGPTFAVSILVWWRTRER